MTYLKYLMHKANLHEDNPALFKRITDLSKYGEFLTQWTKEEFVAFFMNEDKQRSLETVESDRRPTLDEMVEIFEMLDFSREMKIRVDDLLAYISMFNELKDRKFDIDAYKQAVEATNGTIHSRVYMDEMTRRKQLIGDKNDEIKEQLRTFIAHFDGDKDESIGPREFFQIIMSLYE